MRVLPVIGDPAMLRGLMLEFVPKPLIAACRRLQKSWVCRYLHSILLLLPLLLQLLLVVVVTVRASMSLSPWFCHPSFTMLEGEVV